MEQLIEKIKSAEYIYSSQTRLELKKYNCRVFYYTKNDLEDVYFVICSIVKKKNGLYDKNSLGVLLGFGIYDNETDGKQTVYYDPAEKKLFENILEEVAGQHLIVVDGDSVALTNLGRISVETNTHYHFHSGYQFLYEHSSLRTGNEGNLAYFPFYEDLGVFSQISSSTGIWPNDDEIEDIINGPKSALVERLGLQSNTSVNMYAAEMLPLYDFEIKSVPVQLYSVNGEYMPVLMKGEKYAPRTTELVGEKNNELKRENIILECLFQKLWDDESAQLNYIALEPYLELVDYEELTKDRRTVWEDKDLLNVIVENATPICWKNLTHYCNVPIIQSHVSEWDNNLDWAEFSLRAEDDFLDENFMDYPWDLEAISTDYNRDVSVIQKLIVKQKDTSEDWDWSTLELRLSSEFVLSHLDIVRVSLSRFTEDTEASREAIIKHPDCLWDWGKVEEAFSLDYIYNNLETLKDYVGDVIFVDRVLSDVYWSSKFVASTAFSNMIKKESQKGGKLSSVVFNDKEYHWSFAIIDLLASNNLILWGSSSYSVGFECNPSLVWTKVFFEKYASNISTQDGYKHVSSVIKDFSIILENQTFKWDWDSISSNDEILNDRRVFSSLGKNLNWSLVFDKIQDVDFFQGLDGIDKMIGEDKAAWAKFSAIANVDYVTQKYRSDSFPWNWKVLTKRMFSKLRLENIGNELFVNKWDWSFLSKKLDVSFLDTHLDEYRDYWDWSEVFPRIVTDERKTDYEYIEKIAECLGGIQDSEKKTEAWTELMKVFSFHELKKIVIKTSNHPAYKWNLDYFFNHPSFYIIRDIDECRSIIDWEILSRSKEVDDSLVYKNNKKSGLKQSYWEGLVKNVITDDRNKWNYWQLSHFESLKNQRWFIDKYKDRIDWNYISATSSIFCESDVQKLNEVVTAYKDYIDFRELSLRDDINIGFVLRIFPKESYDYNYLLSNDKLKIPLMGLVQSMPEYEWDWNMVTSKEDFVPTKKFIYEYFDKPINWEHITGQDIPELWKDAELLVKMANVNVISEQVDWHFISSLECFPIKAETLSSIPPQQLNWKVLSGRDKIVAFIDEYVDYLDWKQLSANSSLDVSKKEILSKYQDSLDWTVVCGRKDFHFSNDIIETYSDKIDWRLASASTDLELTKEFIERYRDKWDWPVLSRNKAFFNFTEVTDVGDDKKINIIKFIHKFPQPPKAYHFTHLSNAVNILKSMKLQSRNAAEGTFSNSASSNVVNRRGDAHKFARFYFVPKSPTQFYNECLGKDKSSDYYERARGMGLPKCPMPVFFVFSIEEVLMAMPEKCYYSTGNMQKDKTKYYKVVESPNHINARPIYIDNYSTMDERQQEFLVEGELDFSHLKSVSIVCYDIEQKKILQGELEGTRWENVIVVDPSLYVRKNKELFIDDNKDELKITSNYSNPYTIRVSYPQDVVPIIFNSEDIVSQKGSNIYMRSRVKIMKDTPFEIYFEVTEPREGSWLIYKNN